MNREEVLALCRTQTAVMLSAYHDGLSVMLTELLEMVPQPQREPYRSVVQRFTVNVLGLISMWSRS